MNSWTLRNAGLGNYEINRFLAANILCTATESSPYFWVDSLSRWERLSEGLGTQRRTRGIAADNTGKTWIGIDGDGIASLDDTLWMRLRIPGPSSSNFSDITIDKDGEIWGVHYGGFVQERRGKTISHFRNNSWEILNDTNELGIESAIRWVDVDQKNNKWFGIWGIDIDIDILKLSEDGIWDSLALPVGNVVGSQYVDSQDNKWFSNFSSSVCKLLPDDTTWQIYSDENYLNYIVAFADDDAQNMYFGSIQRGVSVLKPDNSWIKLGGLPSQQVHDLTVDEDGDLWIATTASGVVVVRDFSVIRHYTRDNSGLLGDIVHDILIDWKNNKWFLIENRGVSVLKNNGEWDSLTVSDGLASDFIIDDLDGLAFDAQHGYLWIATKDGISRYETGFVPLPPDSELEQVGVFPNPFITREHHRVTFSRLPDDAQVFLYSVSMKRIKVIDEIDGVTHQAFWDGTDENNKPVDSGIYVFVIVHPNGNKKTGKIAVIR
ncbi:MAG: hypothetical protein E3J78_05535 [Candidatus Cloacimonadota bacterium]|nr:MAG: hypothetical protein E3J78_05535 [Candidatus Cloacimonadota bacterium]